MHDDLQLPDSLRKLHLLEDVCEVLEPEVSVLVEQDGLRDPAPQVLRRGAFGGLCPPVRRKAF